MGQYLEDNYLNNILENYFNEAGASNNKINNIIKQSISKRKYIENLDLNNKDDLDFTNYKNGKSDIGEIIGTFYVDIDKFIKIIAHKDVYKLLDSGQYQSIWDIITEYQDDIDREIEQKLKQEINSKLKEEKITIIYLDGDNDQQWYGIFNVLNNTLNEATEFKLTKVEGKIYNEYKKEIDSEIDHLLNKFLKIKLKKISKDLNHNERNKDCIGKAISYDQLVNSVNIYKIDISPYKAHGNYDYTLQIFIKFKKYINEFWTDQSYILQSFITIKKNNTLVFTNETEETT